VCVCVLIAMLMLLILQILAMVVGFAMSSCAFKYVKPVAEEMTTKQRATYSVMGLLPFTGGLLGLLWCFLTPPPFSMTVDGPPAHHRNDPTRSIYMGNGCFWHTQYDFVVLEQEAGVFRNRTDEQVTSLVGYAGGRYQSATGTACYHGWPHLDYSRMGHAEAVSITLNAISGPEAAAQVSALAKLFFGHGFVSLDDGRRQRLDPQDAGAEYRNVIGLPGGMDNAELWPLIEAENTYGMPLIRVALDGPGDDTEDDHVVYVYDSNDFPFFRGEASHQFHKNSVIGRYVPPSYTRTLKQVQEVLGRLDDDLGCAELPFAELTLLLVWAIALIFGLSGVVIFALLPPQLRFWEPSHKEDEVHVVPQLPNTSTE